MFQNAVNLRLRTTSSKSSFNFIKIKLNFMTCRELLLISQIRKVNIEILRHICPLSCAILPVRKKEKHCCCGSSWNKIAILQINITLTLSLYEISDICAAHAQICPNCGNPLYRISRYSLKRLICKSVLFLKLQLSTTNLAIMASFILL